MFESSTAFIKATQLKEMNPILKAILKVRSLQTAFKYKSQKNHVLSYVYDVRNIVPQ